MATLTRPLQMRPRSLRVAIALAAALVAVLVLAATPAGAIVTTVGSANVGLQPRSTSIPAWLYRLAPAPENFANSSGSPIVSTNKTYAIYWDPTDHYHGDWQNQIDKFLQSMSAESGSLASVFAVDAQYTDAANQHALYRSTFMGAYTDTHPYPSVGKCSDPQPLKGKSYPANEPDAITCLTNAQIQEELKLFVADHGLQKGMGTIFYLLTPPGVTVCLDAGGASGHCSDHEASLESYENSFCSYHSDINPDKVVSGDANTILYSAIPWTAGGLADGHLGSIDRTPAVDCQDGGFDPSSKPIEQPELAKEKTKAEEEAFLKMNNEEKQKQKEKEEREGPHQQEPNQVPCPSPDGYCDTGLADLIVNQIGVEQQNIVTNPLLNAWQDPSGNEATDECRNFFAPTSGGSVSANEDTGAGTLFNQSFAGNNYYLNDAFNLASLKLPYPAISCLPGIRLEPQFTVPNSVNSGEIVGFDGMESNITLNAGVGFSSLGAPQPAYTSYTWTFGDGSAPITGFAPGAPSANSPEVSPCVAPWEAPCAASAYHSYQYGGTYEVTLKVTDVGGNVASVVHPVTVLGPPRPAPPSPTPSGGPSIGSAGGPSPSVAPPAPIVIAAPPTPAPVLGVVVTSKSLKKVLKSGVAVRYTANEQVAGSIQVLLDDATAKRLGVHGALATGLPNGSPRLIVVGSAVLVTTKAGQGTLRIKFSPRTAAHLKHAHKLKLTLRLFARNASRSSPQTTTLLSTVVLNP